MMCVSMRDSHSKHDLQQLWAAYMYLKMLVQNECLATNIGFAPVMSDVLPII